MVSASNIDHQQPINKNTSPSDNGAHQVTCNNLNNKEGGKSYCKVQSHENEEIVFACYECSDTFCKRCVYAHRTHTVIFFKDPYLSANFSEVTQIEPMTPKVSS